MAFPSSPARGGEAPRAIPLAALPLHRTASRRGLPPRNGEDGLTLVEMLVVLAIIGVAAGAVTLGIGAATRAPSVESEARRFAGRLQAAADDAMLGDRMIALTIDESGYGFVKVTSDGLIPSGTPTIDYHAMPGGIVMHLSTAPPFVLGVDGTTKPLVGTIAGGRQTWVVRYDGLTATASSATAT